MQVIIIHRKNHVKSYEHNKVGLRRILHRIIIYPLLAPVILLYKITKKQKILDIFYYIRSIPHGIPLKKGYRVAIYDKNYIIFPNREDPSLDDVYLRNVYYPYKPNKEDTVIDIGAHMGFFTIKMAKYVKKIIAIEPDPYNYNFLNKNIKYNSLTNIFTYNYALGSHNGYVNIIRNYGYGRTKISTNTDNRKIKLTTLDNLVEECNIKPTFIKIDTEGYEINVLKGSINTLQQCRPKIIVSCYHYFNEWKEVSAFLQKQGFQCYIYYVNLALQNVRESYIYAIPN